MVLTKRVYSKTKKIFFYGSGTFISFLILLLSLSYLGISTEYSGDIVCGDKCVSYFNITLTNYSLCFGSTFKGLYFDKNISYELYKADLRYRRDNPDRWKPYNFTIKTCLEKGKKYEFMLVGYKNPSDTIKWGASLQGKNIDPYWIGTSGILINPYQNNPERSNYNISIDRGIKISGEDWYARYSVHFRVNNVIYNWDAIPSAIQKNAWKIDMSNDNEIRFKYGYDFSNISTPIKNNLQNVILHLEETEGLTLDDVRREGNTIIIKNKVFISHEDILTNYTIPIINRTDVVIGGLASNFISNGDGTWNITFDPTITISEASVVSTSALINVTAETGVSNFTHLNISTTAPYNNLIGYWSFDGDIENTLLTPVYDFSKNNYDGALLGNATINNTNCIFGDCLWLDGLNVVADAGVSLDPSFTISGNSSIAFSVWIKPGSSQISTDSRVINLDLDECLVRFRAPTNDAEIILNTFTGATDRIASGTNSVMPEVWSHIFAQYNNITNNMSIWVNGVCKGSVIPVGKYGTCNNFYIGMRSLGTAASLYNGSIDELMIFNIGLSDAQIQAIYNNQSARYKNPGTQTIDTINISGDGTENRVNITLGDCETNLGSNLSAQLGVGYKGGSSSHCIDDPGFTNPSDCENILDEASCYQQGSGCTGWVDGVCTYDEFSMPYCNYFSNQDGCEGLNQIDVCTWAYDYNGSVTNFQDCKITNYNITGNPNDVSLRLTLYAGISSNPFYSPLVIGNITLESWYEEEAPPEEIADINYSVALPLGLIRFANCSPDWEFYPSYPIGQDSNIAAINATNNGSATGNFTIRINPSAASKWMLFGCNVSTFSLTNCLTLSTSFQNIWYGVTTTETKKIWLYANCSYVTSNPQTSIEMGVS